MSLLFCIFCRNNVNPISSQKYVKFSPEQRWEDYREALQDEERHLDLYPPAGSLLDKAWLEEAWCIKNLPHAEKRRDVLRKDKNACICFSCIEKQISTGNVMLNHISQTCYHCKKYNTSLQEIRSRIVLNTEEWFYEDLSIPTTNFFIEKQDREAITRDTELCQHSLSRSVMKERGSLMHNLGSELWICRFCFYQKDIILCSLVVEIACNDLCRLIMSYILPRKEEYICHDCGKAAKVRSFFLEPIYSCSFVIAETPSLRSKDDSMFKVKFVLTEKYYMECRERRLDKDAAKDIAFICNRCRKSWRKRKWLIRPKKPTWVNK
jgi:hypothetical protein